MKSKAIILTATGAIFMAMGICDMILWFIAAGGEKSFEDSVKEYQSNFPGWLQNRVYLTILDIVLFGAAIILFVIAIKYTEKNRLKNLLYFLIIVSGLFVFWNWFSLL